MSPFNPDSEPCHTCGNEAEACVCAFAPDIPPNEELLDEFDQDSQYDWDDEDNEQEEDE